MDAITVNEVNKGVQRKGAVRLHIMPVITVVVLLYTLVMTLGWLRDQAAVSLVTRPYASSVSTDTSETNSTILTTIRGWLSTASDSAQSLIDTAPIQQAKDTMISVVQDFRDLLTFETTPTAAETRDSLWLRYLPLEDASNLLSTSESQANAVGVSE